MPFKSKIDKHNWWVKHRDEYLARVKITRKLRWEKYPWERVLKNIKSRCNNIGHHYFKKGILNYLTKEDIKALWFRDDAFSLKKASIDRIDSDGDYTFGNCRFIELSENKPRAHYNKRRVVQC